MSQWKAGQVIATCLTLAALSGCAEPSAETTLDAQNQPQQDNIDPTGSAARVNRLEIEFPGNEKRRKVWVNIHPVPEHQIPQDALIDACGQALDYCLQEPSVPGILAVDQQLHYLNRVSLAFPSDLRAKLAISCATEITNQEVTGGFRSAQRGSFTHFVVLATAQHNETDAILPCQAMEFLNGLTHHQPPSFRLNCRPCNQRQLWQSGSPATAQHGSPVGPGADVTRWYQQAIREKYGSIGTFCDVAAGPSNTDPIWMQPFHDQLLPD